ncbi:MAG: type II secretion system protein GspG [Armatimonadetes bacterium]|nr:type II secretion system protein GspG [Armatimonadota bacterium]
MKLSLRSNRPRLLRDAVWIGVALGVAIVVLASTTVESQQTAKRRVTIKRMLKIRDALARYAIDNAGRLPPSGRLDVLVHRPGPDIKPQPLRWKGPYLSEEDLKDGWGHPFWYLLGGVGNPAPPYQLFSYGRDNSEDGDGPDADIEIWNPDSLVP